MLILEERLFLKVDKKIAVISSDLEAAPQPFFRNMDAVHFAKKVTTALSPPFPAFTRSLRCGHIHHRI